MTAKVLTIAQQKGGAGKTTLVAQLAVAWRQTGLSVALLDIDPQKSLQQWHALRQAQAGDDLPLGAVGGWRVPSELDRLRKHHDLILVDTPPHADTEAKIAVREADMVLVPVQPSSMDVWATGQTLTLAVAERVPAAVVLNRVPARARVIDNVRQMLEDQDMPVIAPAVGNRVAFAASMMEGRAVCETEPRGRAAQEIQALIAELTPGLGL